MPRITRIVVVGVFGLCTCWQVAWAGIMLEGGPTAEFYTVAPGPVITPQGQADSTVTTGSASYDVGSDGFVLLRPTAAPLSKPVLTVDGGSKLNAGLRLLTDLPPGHSGPITDALELNEVTVSGVGSRLEMGSEGTPSGGRIDLGGKSDLVISDGATVGWAADNTCGATNCDVKIGSNSSGASGFNGASNAVVIVTGAGSEFDASNNNGEFVVGAALAVLPTELDGDGNTVRGDDALVIQNGGLVRSQQADIASGDSAATWVVTDGQVQATALIDNATWEVAAPSGQATTLDVGEGNGASGNLIITDGGVMSVTAAEGEEGGFYLGQTDVGAPTTGGSNLLLISGGGSELSVNTGLDEVSGSRVANGFVSVQDGGTLNVDSQLLLISGNSGASLDVHNTRVVSDLGLPVISNTNLEVLSGGSVNITDSRGTGHTALIIGQTPEAGPTQSATVRVSGDGSSIVVDNALGARVGKTEFGIPAVSNIGTGTLTIEDGGSVTINNGDFVIAPRNGDDATVEINGAASSLTADRVIVGHTDFETAGADLGSAQGTLTLNDGVVNGDVIVDNNGTLNGIGTINGTLIADGGTIDPGFSPGTIVAEEFVLNLGSKIILELGINSDGSVDTAQSDGIIATAGGIDLLGEVEFVFTALFDEAVTPLDSALASLVDLGSIFTLDAGQVFNFDPVLASFMTMDDSGGSVDLSLDLAELTINPTRVDEPGTLALLLVGGLGLWWQRRRSSSYHTSNAALSNSV
ncbi:MAG: hypothetical protein GKR90_16220 [Pseudomonadales bacterium]|nr:hypothetical protein [Pseudomonadales bacterium]